MLTGAALAAAGAGALAAYVLGVRPWHIRWGATDEELSEKLPGDELVEHPNVSATHAITIDAPVEEVWPWLVQMGGDRGGCTAGTGWTTTENRVRTASCGRARQGGVRGDVRIRRHPR